MKRNDMERNKKQRDFIKNFTEILEFLRIIFFYGCYTQEDYKKQGISKSRYYQLTANLKSVMGKYLTEVKLSSGQKALAFRKDMFTEPHKALLELYSIKSFTAKHLFTSLAIMQMFSQEEVCFTAADIKNEFTQDKVPSDRTIERCIDHLTEHGFLQCERKGNKKFYTRSSDPLKALPESILLSLAAAADFHCNVIPPATCGHYLLDSIKRRLNENSAPAYESQFLFKHYHLGQILDDGVLWTLLQAMDAQEIVSFLYKGKKEHTIKDIYPCRIIINEETGRQYLFGLNLYENRREPVLYRIDKIRTPEMNGKPEKPADAEEIQQLYETALSHSFTGVFCRPEKLTEVVLAVRKELYPHVLQYFSNAQYEEAEPDWMHIRISVNHFVELKPWLFRNLGEIRILKAPEDMLADFEQDIREWREIYGIDQ
ncbi:MAG: WYL domain-containing protein [Ruminococcus sp.]|nr:WYL domain-containing protein [Ruminococcus sp.]